MKQTLLIISLAFCFAGFGQITPSYVNTLTNGLTKSGSAGLLGGTLNRQTTITGDTFTFKETSSVAGQTIKKFVMGKQSILPSLSATPFWGIFDSVSTTESSVFGIADLTSLGGAKSYVAGVVSASGIDGLFISPTVKQVSFRRNGSGNGLNVQTSPFYQVSLDMYDTLTSTPNYNSNFTLYGLEAHHAVYSTHWGADLAFIGADTTQVHMFSRIKPADSLSLQNQIVVDRTSIKLDLGSGNQNIVLPDFANSTYLYVDASGYLRKGTVPVYADDAAAVGAGLVSGQFYQTTTAGSTYLKILP